MFIELFPTHIGWVDTIESERLILRKSDEDRDLSLYHKHLSDDGDFEMFSGLQLTTENVEKFGMELCGSYYSIFEKTTNNMVGYVAITFHELWQEEIEFYIFKNYRRKGYAYEACSNLLRYYFTVSEEAAISSTTRMDNIATKGLLKKLGFSYLRNVGMVLGENIGLADDVPIELYTKFEASAIKINIPTEHLDKGIDDMECGAEMPIDDAFQMVGVILEQRRGKSERKALDMAEKEYFIIEDIKHTGHHGEKGTSKVGEKYERRRGHEIYLYSPLKQYEQYRGESIMLMDRDSEDEEWFIRTTPFVELREHDVYVELETLNSIYVLRRTIDRMDWFGPIWPDEK